MMEPSFTSSEGPPQQQSNLANLVRYAERIREWTAGKSFSDYQANILLSDAVERNFIEVGEIINRLEDAAPDLYRQIPQAQRWYAFRIILVHLRWQIDHTIVWDTIQKDLPILIEAANSLLQLDDEYNEG